MSLLSCENPRDVSFPNRIDELQVMIDLDRLLKFVIAFRCQNS